MQLLNDCINCSGMRHTQNDILSFFVLAFFKVVGMQQFAMMERAIIRAKSWYSHKCRNRWWVPEIVCYQIFVIADRAKKVTVGAVWGGSVGLSPSHTEHTVYTVGHPCKPYIQPNKPWPYPTYTRAIRVYPCKPCMIFKTFKKLARVRCPCIIV